jgi:hypothetical protein
VRPNKNKQVGGDEIEAAAMAKLTDEHRYVDLGRTGKGKKVRWMRLGVLDLLVVVLAPGNHRRCTGDEHLRGETAVTVGGTNQEGRRKKQGSRGRARLPGTR